MGHPSHGVLRFTRFFFAYRRMAGDDVMRSGFSSSVGAAFDDLGRVFGSPSVQFNNRF